MCDLMTIIFADVIEKKWIKEYEDNYSYFVDLLLEYCPGMSTLKFHLMSHYAEMMKKFGPLSRWSTADFERKNELSSRKMKNTRCFKNPTLTMSKNHQWLQLINDFPNNIIRKFEVINPKPAQVEQEHQEFLQQCCSNLLKCDSIFKNGLEISVGCFYCTEQNEKKATFFRVTHIYIDNNKKFVIIGNEFKGGFIAQKYFYSLTENTICQTLNVDSIISSRSFKSYIYNDKNVIFKSQKLTKLYLPFKM